MVRLQYFRVMCYLKQGFNDNSQSNDELGRRMYIVCADSRQEAERIAINHYRVQVNLAIKVNTMMTVETEVLEKEAGSVTIRDEVLRQVMKPVTEPALKRAADELKTLEIDQEIKRIKQDELREQMAAMSSFNSFLDKDKLKTNAKRVIERKKREALRKKRAAKHWPSRQHPPVSKLYLKPKPKPKIKTKKKTKRDKFGRFTK